MLIHVEAGHYRRTLEEIIQTAAFEGVGVTIAAFMREMHVMPMREFRGSTRDVVRLAHDILDNYRGLRIEGKNNRATVCTAIKFLRAERRRLAKTRGVMPGAANVAGSVALHRT